MPHARVAAVITSTLSVAACGGAPAAAPPPILDNAAAPGAASVPPSLAGRYVAVHPIMVTCSGPDGWCEEPAEDTLVVRDLGDGRLAIEVEVLATNAHSCTFEGELAPVVDGPSDVRRWRFAGVDELLGACEVVLAHDPARRRLEVSSDGCRYYCGARASLDAGFDVP